MALLVVILLGTGLDPASVDEQRVRNDRLVALAKLWGFVKFHHPKLLYDGSIDWDSALIEAIPKLRSARDTAEASAAYAHMLNALGDAASRLVEADDKPGPDGKNEDVGFDSYVTEDGIQVITVGDYYGLWPQAARIEEARRAIGRAKAVVLDLRSAVDVESYGRFQMNSALAGIERAMIPVPLTTVGRRVSVRIGFESTSTFASGQYQTGFYTQSAKRLQPGRSSPIPCVFLLNEKGAWLASTIPLQAAGEAMIVFEGDPANAATENVETIDLGEGLEARVRIAESILHDGRNGELVPDVVVEDGGLEKAMTLARNFEPSKVERARLPSIAVPEAAASFGGSPFPSLPLRLMALFRLWSTIRYFYPYHDLLEEDWDEILPEFLTRFEEASDARAYALAVAEVATRIHDSHTYLAGGALGDFFGKGFPPIRVQLVEARPVITRVFDRQQAEKVGLEIGDIVLEVDGEDAEERLSRYAEFTSASNRQFKMDRAAQTFMNGPVGSMVRLVVCGRDGEEREARLTRRYEDFGSLYHRERTGEVIRLLPGNVGYVDLDRFDPNEIDGMLSRFAETKAIIFDMRGYPKGVFSLLPQRLTDRVAPPAAVFHTPVVGRVPNAPTSSSFVQYVFPAQPGSPIYRGRTVMLIDQRSLSQAEHTGMFLKAANDTIFVGSPTGGANGEVTSLSLPGGITVGFTGQAVTWPDGRPLQRTGLIPDVAVEPTIEGIRSGRDEVLEKALEMLETLSP